MAEAVDEDEMTNQEVTDALDVVILVQITEVIDVLQKDLEDAVTLEIEAKDVLVKTQETEVIDDVRIENLAVLDDRNESRHPIDQDVLDVEIN